MRLHSRNTVLGETPDTLRVVPARVLIEGSRIAAVEEGAEARPGDHALGDRLLAPAFVNAHTHLALHACRGLTRAAVARGNLVEDLFFAVERHLEEGDVEAFTRIGAMECLLTGSGAVFDHYYHGLAVARGARDCGLVALVSPTLQDRSGPGTHLVEKALEETIALDDAAWSEGGILAAVGPHATDTASGTLWRRALEVAEGRDLVLHAHVAQSPEEARRALEEHGCAPLEWLHREGLLDSPAPQLLVHALYVSDAELAHLDPRRHRLGASPFSQMQFAFPAPVPEWVRAGLDWFVGTDCGASNDSMDLQKELRVLAGQATWEVTASGARAQLRSGVDRAAVDAVARERERALEGVFADERQLLHRVWAGPGRWAPGLDCGVIAPGARAQLVVLETGHPALWPGTDLLRGLAFGGVAGAVHGVIARGKWVGEPGRPAAFLERDDVREWFAEARARHEALLRRAGIL